VASLAVTAGKEVKESARLPKTRAVAIEFGKALADLGEALGYVGHSHRNWRETRLDKLGKGWRSLCAHWRWLGLPVSRSGRFGLWHGTLDMKYFSNFAARCQEQGCWDIRPSQTP
jgi:hypothetical protein